MTYLRNFFLLLFTAAVLLACVKQKRYESPAHFTLNKPVRYGMPESLLEISGIALNNGNPDTIYAQQDEEGKLFYLKLTDKTAKHTKFAKHGDYEDISILNGQAILLKSNGTFFTFALNNIKTEEAEDVKEWKKLLPKGEYEGLYGDAATGKLYVLAKSFDGDKKAGKSIGYILNTSAVGLTLAGEFSFNTAAVAKKLDEKKGFALRPSALAKDPLTAQWYIVSSLHKVLLITDGSWNVKEIYPLDPRKFNQPEGIAFDKSGNLYISNEGDELNKGNVLFFKRNK